MPGRMLIVDDERLTRATLEVHLRDEGFEVFTAANGFEALAVLEKQDVDVVITDLRMPSMDGLTFQRTLAQRWPHLIVVFMSAFGSVNSAVEAMRAGAADFLTKPLNADELVIRIRRLLQHKEERLEVTRLRKEAGSVRRLGGMVFQSRDMEALLDNVQRVAEMDVPVLLCGEHGTGKEMLARAIHGSSARATSPFVVVTCSALAADAADAEVFGHEAGALAGGSRLHRGRLETAAGGTLYLDEVDALPASLQVKLLRFLEQHTFERRGGAEVLKGDVRILAGTHQPLADLVRRGQFREDLWYRINAITLDLPPLRARRGDILPLAEHFLTRWSATLGHAAPPSLAPEVVRVLLTHDWPGNVGELEHAMEHAVALTRGGPLHVSHLPATLQQPASPELLTLNLQGREQLSFTETIETCERRLLEWALSQSGGNQARAAEMLHLSRTTLRSKLGALGGVAAASDKPVPT